MKRKRKERKTFERKMKNKEEPFLVGGGVLIW
jgi:hypothetical protein